MQPTLADRILVFLQKIAPARTLASFIYLLSRSRRTWLKNRLIKGFCALYDVDITEAAAAVPEGYASFNDFFSRELKAGARPLSGAAGAIISPADGTIAELGCAQDGQLLQAKGMKFTAVSLLGDAPLAMELANSPFITIYLAPYNYHRVHIPMDAQLRSTAFIPGKLYSVNARTAATVPNLYSVNERLVCHFTSRYGPFALVMVGAMNVASITTHWGGEISPPDDGRILRESFDADNPLLDFKRGDYIGHFNMGSTVVMIGPTAGIRWQDARRPATTVRMGDALGQVTDPA